MRPCLILLAFLLLGLYQPSRAQAQNPADTTRLLVLSPLVGEVIDAREKATYGLFPYYSADNFAEARFYQALRPDSTITLRTLLRDGRTAVRRIGAADFQAMRRNVDSRARTVGAAPPLAAASDSVGRQFQVTLRSGTVFVGTLQALRPRELEFDTPDLGRVVTPRSSIVTMTSTTGQGRRSRWDYVGNGTRIFFAPTARTLRKGEGYVQDIDFILVGANYGITDHVSVGALLSVIPGLGLGEQLFAVTPKFGAPLRNDRWHLGGGVLYARAGGYGAGVAYGLATYGSADQNVTFGLGYGFSQGEVGRSPVFVLGGVSRIGRRISLMSENYVFAAGPQQNIALGLYGIRLNWPRTTFSLGAAYAAYDGEIVTTYVYPVYLDVAFRFGQVK
jgi:hypothetical protein